MQKRKGFSVILTAALTAAVILSGDIFAAAEPSEALPPDTSYLYTESSLQESAADPSAASEPVSAPEESEEPEEPQDSSQEPEESSAYVIISDESVVSEEPSEPSVEEPEELLPVVPEKPIRDDPYHNVTIHVSDFYPEYSSPAAENSDSYETEALYEEPSYEAPSESPPEPERDTSALDISGYEISDLETLTSQDWEELKKVQQEASRFEMRSASAGNTRSAFGKMKQDSKGGNDDWIFLVWGIGLIIAGAAAIISVIVTTRQAGKRRSR